VVFDTSSQQLLRDTTVTDILQSCSAPSALDSILTMYGVRYVQVDVQTIAIVSKEYKDVRVLPIAQIVLEAEIKGSESRARSSSAGDLAKLEFDYQDTTLYSAISMLGQSAHLGILFDPAVEDSARATSLSVTLRGITLPGALAFILDSYDLEFAQIDNYTIRIVSPDQDHTSTPLAEIIKNLQ
jgi:hypothetical protein